jgi:uncharacterized protein YybS (DUF2232 family)
MKKLSNLNFFLMWIFGFFVLLSFDLFVEGFVFEWLEWNFSIVVGSRGCLVLKRINIALSKI